MGAIFLRGIFKTKKSLILFLAATLLVAVGAPLAVLVYQLDRTIVAKFEAGRYRLPSKVYARPLELHVGGRLSMDHLKRELDALGYRETTQVNAMGEFAVSGDVITIYRRDFAIFEGAEDPVIFEMTLQNDTVTVLTRQKGEALDSIRMDPLVIGGIYPNQFEDRILVKTEQVPQLLVDGLVLLEDRHFFEHHGIDPAGVLRAAVANLRAGRITQGGSTLTQQLVKNFFLSNARNFRRKLVEVIYALLIELHYSKSEILETYLNEVYFGQDGPIAVHGFGLASAYYFDKKLEELPVDEQAILIAMLGGPAYYNPRAHPVRLAARRNKVLQLLCDAGKISRDAYAKAQSQPINITARKSHYYGAYLDLVKRHLMRDYAQADLQEAGLKIHTSFNPVSQWVAQEAVQQVLAGRFAAHDALEVAVIVSSLDGEVEAMVGGRNPALLGFNHALDAARTIGSLVKPVVAAAALAMPDKFTLVTPLEDEPITIVLDAKHSWTPENYDHDTHGVVPLYEMIAHSYNLAAVHLGHLLPLELVGQTLSTLAGAEIAVEHPSALLGAITLTPYQVAQIYQSIANDGFRSPLRSVREVQTRSLAPLKSFALTTAQVFPPEVIYLVKYAMSRVIAEGTAASVQKTLPADYFAAGKTGTSSAGRDAWFAGFNEHRLVLVWVGYDDNSASHFTGASLALPIWTKIIAQLDSRSSAPPPPSGIEVKLVARTPGECRTAREVPFIKGSAPAALDCAPRPREGPSPMESISKFMHKLLE